MKSLNLSDIIAKLIFFVAILIVACIFLFKGCDEESSIVATPDKTDSIKKVYEHKFQLRIDSLDLVKKKDSISYVTIVKYKYLKGKIDSIPCDSLLPQIVNICDSIVYNDSSLISSLKNIIKLDSSIFVDMKRVIVNDSTTIVSLNKEVKKQKRQKRLIGGIGAIGWLVAIFK